MTGLEDRLGYRFRDQGLLRQALTHCSYAAEHPVEHNQRLEFLGDAILEHAVSDYLFRHCPKEDEGKMTRKRAAVVSERPLAAAARSLGLSEFVLLGAGEKMSGGADKDSVLSDTLESLFAAVYLDGGYEAAEHVILAALAHSLENPEEDVKDFKTKLQERLFRNGNVTVEYHLLSQVGPPHDSVFTVSVSCNGQLLGTGKGSSKKKAEQAAAEMALADLT